MSPTRTRLLAGAGIAAAAGAVLVALRRLRARRAAPVRIPTAGRPLALVRDELAAEESRP